LEADIWTSDIFADPHLGGFRLRYEVKVGTVELRPNSLSSRWEDVITLVSKGTLVAFRPDAAEDCSTEFRQLYAEAIHHNPDLGAAIRWNTQSKGEGDLRLLLQCLPATADRIRAEPRLSADDGPAIHLETIELETEFLGASDGPGLVPVVFARDPREIRELLTEYPDRIETGTYD
jgi:hypothetical protein